MLQSSVANGKIIGDQSPEGPRFSQSAQRYPGEIKPKPVFGAEFTLLTSDAAINTVARSPETGQPISLFIRADGTPLFAANVRLLKIGAQVTDRIAHMVVNAGKESYDREKIEAARKVLWEMGVFGHSITAAAGTDIGVSNTPEYREKMARDMYSVHKFGLWSSQNGGPYMASFGKYGNENAGDRFNGYAVVAIDGRDIASKKVWSPDGGNDGFFPPTELIFIVPSAAVKEDMLFASETDVDIDKTKQRRWKLEERIFTLDDIIAGKLTAETLEKLRTK